MAEIKSEVEDILTAEFMFVRLAAIDAFIRPTNRLRVLFKVIRSLLPSPSVVSRVFAILLN